jgi:hypothetical protein
MSAWRASPHWRPAFRRAFMRADPTHLLQMSKNPVIHRRHLDHRHHAHLDAAPSPRVPRARCEYHSVLPDEVLPRRRELRTESADHLQHLELQTLTARPKIRRRAHHQARSVVLRDRIPVPCDRQQLPTAPAARSRGHSTSGSTGFSAHARRVREQVRRRTQCTLADREFHRGTGVSPT